MARPVTKLSLSALANVLVYTKEMVEGKEVTTGIDLAQSEERFREVIMALEDFQKAILKLQETK